jgi:outer membrane protein OmpA-like peptidoglycan-associated protein/ABC-type nitrate/sulfonate/bicarbonate transport system substrate-binding protein
MAEARLTPLAKILIAVVVLGATGAAAWHLGLKNLFYGDGETASNGNGDGNGSGNGSGNGTGVGSGPAVDPNAPLGSSNNPLKVSIVSFHGYAPALVANGSSLRTQPGSIFAQKNVTVEFVIQDDIPPLATIFESGAAHCAWRTSDFWAQEQPNLRNAGFDGRAVMIVDNTQGGDAVIARGSGINRIEDLVGKKVALLQFTPSHGMLIDAIENSSLSARQKTQIEMVFVNVEEGTAGVRAAFEAGHVDAAVLWDPDLALALRAVQGSHEIYSTRIATNLIYDVIVCNKAVLDVAANEAVIQSFVAGWIEGTDRARGDHDLALRALLETEEAYALLARNNGNDFVKSLFPKIVWTNLADNVRILGLAPGGTNHYKRVYQRFDGIYRAAGALANPNSPVINPDDSFDYRFIRSLMQAAPQVTAVAQQPEFTFTAEERQEVQEATPVVTRPVTVNFATGSAELTERAKQVINTEMVPLIENHGSAYFEVSGNTDSTGNRAQNVRLSQQRANAVVEYLVTQWEFPRERFVVTGNGPDQPLCNEQAPEEGMSIDDCRARNRTTRVGVLQRQEEQTN